jgi:hypothetical protein
MNEELPPDPFGAPEEMVQMMRGMHNLHNAALVSGFPEHVATQFIIGVFCSLMSNALSSAAKSEETAEE